MLMILLPLAGGGLYFSHYLLMERRRKNEDFSDAPHLTVNILLAAFLSMFLLL